MTFRKTDQRHHYWQQRRKDTPSSSNQAASSNRTNYSSSRPSLPFVKIVSWARYTAPHLRNLGTIFGPPSPYRRTALHQTKHISTTSACCTTGIPRRSAVRCKILYGSYKIDMYPKAALKINSGLQPQQRRF